ncbi:pineal opsin-like [Euwallacea fornicatus]|uniref:pineal opsin-like n=1 Tax=Euwallacea fornicatus TaxID=995702 RepID=UPI00338FB52A
MCVIYGFFMSLLGIAAITTLTVMAFVRFLIVSKPFRNQYLGSGKSLYIVAGIWLYSLSLTAPPLFGWGKYVNEAANISCSVNWEDQSVDTTAYILYLFFFGLIAPLAVIIYSYAHILATMKKNKLNIGRVNRMESRTTYMILVMILAFLIAWTPYAVFALLAQFADPALITPATAVLPALIAKSSICYNPVIYIVLNNQFRQSFKQMFSKNRNSKNSICDTYALAVSKCVCQPNSPERVLTDSRRSTMESNGQNSAEVRL